MEAGVSKWTIIAPAAKLIRARGLDYLVCWGHRVAGILLAAFIIFHVHTLSLLKEPETYSKAMERLGSFPFPILEWALAVPLIFHALNGARLLLYEWYPTKDTSRGMRWMGGLCLVYLGLLAVFMISPSSDIPLGLFWLPLVCAALLLSYVTAKRVLAQVKSALFWGMQRISAAFLLVMLPAHMLLMHSVPDLARQPVVISSRLDNPFVLVLDLAIVIFLAYHMGYGLFSILSDYVPWRTVRGVTAVLAWVFLGLLALWAMRVLFMA